MRRAALSERDRTIILASGIIAFALIHLVLAAVLRSGDFGDVAVVYPPHTHLLLLPLVAMPPAAAVAIWSALNLFCVFRAGELMGPRRDLALIACVSPATLAMLVSGYAGGFLALLAAVVVLQGRKRPGLAGLNLALMTLQPQFAVAFALVLLVAGYARAVLLAIAWTLALLAASMITFGVQPWAAFFDAQVQAHPAISLYAGARVRGLPEWAAQAVQWSFAVVALTAAALVFTRRGLEARSIALLLLAVILALPNATAADLVIAAPALTLALFDNDVAERPFLPFAAALLLWTAPAAVSISAAWPLVSTLMPALLLYALAREIAWPSARAARDAIAERKGAL